MQDYEGFKPSNMYTKYEFDEACQFNLWIGAALGVVFTLSVEAGYAWAHGWF